MNKKLDNLHKLIIAKYLSDAQQNLMSAVFWLGKWEMGAALREEISETVTALQDKIEMLEEGVNHV